MLVLKSSHVICSNDFSTLVLSSASHKRPASAKNIKFTLNINTKKALIKSDEDYIYIAIFNIVDNAIKYSPLESEIAIKIKEKGGKALLEIKDVGRGFKDSYLTEDFSDFFSSYKEKKGRMGINLYLAYLIINYLNGDLEYGNNKEIGAFVRILL
jgi:two-component system sensor histidine kinase KdpD